jgi:hypothetical protein
VLLGPRAGLVERDGRRAVVRHQRQPRQLRRLRPGPGGYISTAGIIR